MRKKVQGVGLIEVLVTLLVLSTSLLALASLQARSLQYNHGSYLRSQANIYAYDLLERVRINRDNINDYNVDLAAFDVKSAPVTSPLAAADLDDWRRQIATNFAGGKGAVKCDSASSICKVTITWDEINSAAGTEKNAAGLVDEDSTTFTYETRI